MKKGFTLIEIMFSIALAAVILPALVNVLSFSLKASKQSESYTKAYALAQEQMEAVYSIKESGSTEWEWTSTKPENTTVDEFYQPTQAGNVWNLGVKTTTPGVIDGFTKKVRITDFPSDGTHDDTNSRWITVNVTWKENGEDTQVELTSLVTRY